MQPHIHTGVIAFIFTGISAVVFIKLSKIGAAALVNHASTESVGKWLGGVLD